MLPLTSSAPAILTEVLRSVSCHRTPVIPTAANCQESLRRAFATLSPRSAEVFALRHLEDFSNGEIARMLGISQILVAVTLHRARRQLQKEIRSYFGGTL